MLSYLYIYKKGIFLIALGNFSSLCPIMLGTYVIKLPNFIQTYHVIDCNTKSIK